MSIRSLLHVITQAVIGIPKMGTIIIIITPRVCMHAHAQGGKVIGRVVVVVVSTKIAISPGLGT